MEKCKQTNLQEIKALKRALFFIFPSQIQGGLLIVSFDSDGEAPRGPESANDRAY